MQLRSAYNRILKCVMNNSFVVFEYRQSVTARAHTLSRAVRINRQCCLSIW